MTVQVVDEALRILAPGASFELIEGEALERLQEGRAVRFDLELAVLAESGNAMVAERRQSVNVSYDLWEERFAVSLVGTEPRSISHLTAEAAEAWCLEQLTVPLAALGSVGRDTPFWIRLAFRVENREPAEGVDDGGRLSLRSLIDVLSRRGQDDELRDSVEAGPFYLPD